MENTTYRYHFNNVSAERLKCGGFALYQYGELWCNADSSVAVHSQCCYELTYVLAGSGTVQTGNRIHRVRENDCVVSLPGETHAITPDSNDPLRFAFIAFERNPGNPSCSYLFDELGRLFRAEDARSVPMQDRSALIVRMFSELQSESLFRMEMTGYLLAELLVELIRAATNERPGCYFPKITDDSVLVYRLETYITDNICELTKLEDLEKVFNYNYSYLSKRFRKITGKHLSAFYLSKRMKEADRLLSDGLTVTQVSDRLGYSSIHSFSRSYKNYYGTNPSRFAEKGEEPQAEPSGKTE